MEAAALAAARAREALERVQLGKFVGRKPAPLTGGPIIVEDNGTGMTEREVRSDYLAIATLGIAEGSEGALPDVPKLVIDHHIASDDPAGDVIVVEGGFLLDSEAQLRGATAGAAATATGTTAVNSSVVDMANFDGVAFVGGFGSTALWAVRRIGAALSIAPFESRAVDVFHPPGHY